MKRLPPSLSAAVSTGILLVSLVSTSTFAGLRGELDTLFNGMTTTTSTSPQVGGSISRGVFAADGGTYKERTPIVSADYLSYSMPSFEAGCGGIDLHGGSISFVSTDDIVNAMRAVAGNAKGYAFQLALDAVCSSCASTMESFLKQVQDLNQHFSNSCEAARLIVDKAGGEIAAEKLAELFRSNKGDSQDTAEASSEDSKKELSDEERVKLQIAGNIVWQQMMRQNLSNWFASGGDDPELLFTLMSLSGTYILHHPDEDSGESPTTTLPPIRNIMTAMIEGGTVSIYECAEGASAIGDEGACLNINDPMELNLAGSGIAERISNALLGDGESTGVIYKYRTNSGVLTDGEMAVLVSLPSGAGTVVRNLSILSPDMARVFVRDSAAALALQAVMETAEDMLGAISSAVAQTQSPHAAEVNKVLDSARENLRSEYRSLRDQYGTTTELIARYNELIKNIRTSRYMSQSLSPRSNPE